MFPLLVGSVNLTGEEVDVPSQDLHHKTGGPRGGPLRFLFPVRVAGLEIMQEDVAVIVGIVASTLLQRFFQIPFGFRYAIDCEQNPSDIVRSYVVPLGNLPGFLEAGPPVQNRRRRRRFGPNCSVPAHRAGRWSRRVCRIPGLWVNRTVAGHTATRYTSAPAP